MLSHRALLYSSLCARTAVFLLQIAVADYIPVVPLMAVTEERNH